MLVELKKVKLTSSIIKQIQIAGFDEMVAEHVIGWVDVKGLRKIIIQNPTTKVLRYHLWPKEIEVEKDNVQIDNHGTREWQYCVLYHTQRGTVRITDRIPDEVATNNRCLRMQEFKNAARAAGQVFY